MHGWGSLSSLVSDPLARTLMLSHVGAASYGYVQMNFLEGRPLIFFRVPTTTGQQ